MAEFLAVMAAFWLCYVLGSITTLGDYDPRPSYASRVLAQLADRD